MFTEIDAATHTNFLIARIKARDILLDDKASEDQKLKVAAEVEFWMRKLAAL